MAKKLAVLFGVIFVLVGVLGFIPNPIAGPTGIFQTDGIHNLVHFIIGVVLLIVAFAAPAKSSAWLTIVGVIYLLLAVLGFLMISHGGMLLGMVTMNMADHWLHVVLGVVLVVAGMATKGSSRPAMPMGMGMGM